MRSEPIRVLYFSSFANFRYGGQRSLYHLVCNLGRTAFIPHVIVPAEGELAERLRARGVAVSPLDLPKAEPGRALVCGRAVRRIHSILREGDFDLVHTDGPRNTLYAGLAASLEGIPLVWHIRSSDRDRYDRLLCRLCSRLILVADALRERFDFAAARGKCLTIHNGVDLEEFRPHGVPSPPAGLERRGAEVVLACAARVEPQKGQDRLVEALGRLGKGRRTLGLLLCGEIADEGYRWRCEETARRHGVADRVQFLGHRPDIAGVLSAADLVVLPSLSGEAFPRVVIEAMALGKPVVATDVGGTREAIDEGVTGYIVPPGDSGALAERIERLAASDALRASMGKTARHRAEKFFSIEANVRTTEKLYREMMNGDRAGYGHRKGR
ncbi:MAG: glycosyltransferase [Pseudomonadota bacterium]|jgi:glycosyltransferase involved in cell wall biosynthesis|nr:glycosyltransferase [Pseudomonadota bacterium]NLX32247.1 glycosyltransferase family 4 protein [Deltaproteobacteria bacterium]HNU85851.1 glycosyltransferase [Syntrophales bacterium]HNZ35036.1 glycosyltransferase [Syntrophales bacterium]HOF73833.1 glycosyltransferase [Syntrophales bacterium]